MIKGISMAVQQIQRATECNLSRKCLEAKVASLRWRGCTPGSRKVLMNHHKLQLGGASPSQLTRDGARRLMVGCRIKRQGFVSFPSTGIDYVGGLQGQDRGGVEKCGGEEGVLSSLLRSCIRRQLDEMDAIRATYPEAFWMSDEESNCALDMLEVLDEEETRPAPNLSLSFSVHLVGPQVGACGHVSVAVTFPRLYPVREAAIVRVECGSGISERQLEMIATGSQGAADELLGTESALHVLHRVQELAACLEEEAGRPEFLSSQTDARVLSRDSRFLQRRAVWFHHIRSPFKKRCIKEWSESLNIGGYVKVGRPGVLIFEGASENVHEYMKRIRKLKWQAMELRGVEQEEPTQGQDLDELRRFPVGVKQLPEDDLTELRTKCCEENLEHLFLLALNVRTQG